MGLFKTPAEKLNSALVDFDEERVEKLLGKKPDLAKGDLTLTTVIGNLRFKPRAAGLRVLKRLLECGADPNRASTARCNQEPLAKCATTPNKAWDAARILIEHGADPNVITSDGCPVLHKIISMHWEESGVRTLVEGGADLDARDGKGATPLHCAVNRAVHFADPDMRILKYLLEKGADPQAEDEKGKKPSDPPYLNGNDQLEKEVLEILTAHTS